MLRLIGAIVVVLLIIGPLLLQAGLLDNGGVFRQLVEIEVQAFADLVAWLRMMFARLG
ncbi:MAG TPA: hypothetical protein VHS58_22885 [Acetobacteraceae bacterium]|nr:hypothetical protein [Acetobacteraceae bacterium]